MVVELPANGFAWVEEHVVDDTTKYILTCTG